MIDSNWSQRKKISIYLIIFLILLSTGVFAYFKYQEYKIPVPSCKDDIQNQDEKGIDCEGVCITICKNNVKPIKSLYTKVISSQYGTYDIVSMIENVNVGKSTGLQAYKINIYNSNREKIKEVAGDIYIPDAIKFPIILLNQKINDNAKFADIELLEQNYIPINKHTDTIKVTDYKYDNEDKKLYIKLKNTSLYKSNKLIVKALIINNTGVIAVNESKIKALYEGEERDLNMTWYESIGDLNNYRVEIYVLEDN